MFIEFLCLAVIGGGLVKDAIEQNQPYYGTERELFRNNPKAQENQRNVDEIIARAKAEYIKKHGNSW